MRVSKTIDSYNARRYGTPWAARITAFNGRPELDFVDGAYNGTDAGGELVFDAQPGEIVKIGQKDFRGHGGSNDFYRVNTDASLTELEPIEARKAWDDWMAQSIEDDRLTVSISKLAAALARYGLKDAEKAAIIRAAAE